MADKTTIQQAIRYAIEGAEAVRRDMQAMQRQADETGKAIEKSTDPANKGLLALSKASKGVVDELGSMAGRLPVIGPSLAMLGPAGVAAGAGLLAVTTAVTLGTKAAAEQEIAFKRVDAVLRGTGMQAGVTAKDVRDITDDLARSTLATKEDVLGASAALATFGGTGRDTFAEMLKQSQNLAALGFGTLRDETEVFGRTLENPIEGATKLNRQLGFLSPALRNTIEDLSNSGRKAEATGLILQEVARRVGGAGAAETDTMTGAFTQLRKELNETLQLFGDTERPRKFAQWLTEIARATNEAGKAQSGLKATIGMGGGFGPVGSALGGPAAAIAMGLGAGGGAGQGVMVDVSRSITEFYKQRDAAAGAKESNRNILLQEADDLTRTLDPLAVKTRVLTAEQTLLNKAIAESGDPTGTYARALGRVNFELGSLRDPVQRMIADLGFEAQARAHTGLVAEQMLALHQAEQTAIQTGRPLREDERRQILEYTDARYRATLAVQAQALAERTLAAAAESSDAARLHRRDPGLDRELGALREEGKRLFEETRTPLEHYRAELERIKDLLSRGAIDPDTYLRAGKEALDRFRDAGVDRFAELERAIEGFGRRTSRLLADTFASGKLSVLDFGKFAQSIISEVLEQMIYGNLIGPGLKAASGFLRKQFETTPSPGGGIGANPLAAFYNPTGYAAGTDNAAPGWHPVGEKGPEWVNFGRGGGSVVPADSLAPSAPIFTFNIDARGAEAGVENRIRQVLAQETPGIVARAVDATRARAQRDPAYTRSFGR